MKLYITNLILLLGCLLVVNNGCIQKRQVKAPVAKKIKTTHSMHGVEWEDDYAWLKNRDAEDVLDYLQAENEYTDAMTKSYKPLQDSIYDEIIGKIKETDETVPEKDGDYYYYTRTVEGEEYQIYCRKKGSLDAEEEIFLDVNQEASGHDFYSVDLVEISPNGKMMAFAVDTTGREEYTIRFKDLSSGKFLKEEISNCYASLVWANDNKTVFYTVLDKALRPYRVYRHKLKSENADELVYEEKDEKFWMDLSRTKSDEYIFINLSSTLTSEILYLDADNPEDAFQIFSPREQNIEYSVYHHKKEFFIVTNWNATNFKIMVTDESKTEKLNWKDLFPYDSAVKTDFLDVFEDYLAVFGRKGGNMEVIIVDLETMNRHSLNFGEEVYTYSVGQNNIYKSKELRLTFSSPITPKTVIDYNMETKTKNILKVYEVPNYDKSLYETKRLYATASDGAKIPLSLVYKKGIKLDGSNPVYLYGYGAYGLAMEPRFRPHSFPLLDRGVIYVIAHIRGGDELGRTWYEDGKFLKKKNTFTDFIASAEYLISEKYTSADKLIASGGSAGGLLIGAVANMRPDLFQVMVADVPFVDVVNTMLDPSIPLTVVEYEEWGDPNDKEYFDYMMSYCPYDNIKAQEYPNMLVTAGLNDPRVQYWEPAKYTAKLRATKTDNNLLVLKTNMGAGHMGASGRYEFYDELAFEYAFVLKQLKN